MLRISCSAIIFCRDRRDCWLLPQSKLFYSVIFMIHLILRWPKTTIAADQFHPGQWKSIFSCFHVTVRSVKQGTPFGSGSWDLNTGTAKLLPFINSLFSLFLINSPLWSSSTVRINEEEILQTSWRLNIRHTPRQRLEQDNAERTVIKVC